MCKLHRFFTIFSASCVLLSAFSGLSVNAASKQVYTLTYEETARLFGYTDFQVATSSRVTVPYYDSSTETYSTIFSPSMWYTNYTSGTDNFIGIRFFVNRATFTQIRKEPYSVTCNFPTAVTLSDLYDFTLGAGFLCNTTADPKPNEYWYALYYENGSAKSKFNYFSTPYTTYSLTNADTGSKTTAAIINFSPDDASSPIYKMYTTGTSNFELIFQGINANSLSVPFDDAGIFDGYSYLFLRCPTIVADSDTISALQIALGTKTPEPEPEPDYSENGVFGWIGNAISALGDKIINGIKGIFVPEAGYLDAKFHAIKEKFAFWESVSDTAQVITNWFETAHWDEPPVVTVNFSNGVSAHGVDYGTSAKILDFSWYEPYKYSVDIIISAFLWVFFIWRIYLALPNIIAGVAPQAIFDTFQASEAGMLDVPFINDKMWENHIIRQGETGYRAKRAWQQGARRNGRK